MNYRDFYKNKKSNRKPVSETMEEKELLKGINLEDNSCDDGLPKRDDGSLDIEHNGRPIHLSKIISVGAEFGNGPSDGALSGMTNVGSPHKSKGADLSKDQEGPNATEDGDKESLTAGGKPVDPTIASKSVGGKVTGGQKQGGPNTKGSIAGTPDLGGGVGEEDGVFTLQEARTKLREMVKEVLKEITFDKKSGKWIRLDEGKHKAGCECNFCKNKGAFGKKKDKDKEEMDENFDAAGFPTDGTARPQYKIGGPQYRCADEVPARTRQFEPEITEMHDEEEECMQQERYDELVNAPRNLSESELSELKNLSLKLERKDKWIQKAVDKSHKGYCTPMTKKTCTPHRKALAKRFKSGDLSQEEEGIQKEGWAMGEYTPEQQKVIDILMKRGFKEVSSFPSQPDAEGENTGDKVTVVMQKRKGPTTFSGEVEPDGSVNGQPVDQFLMEVRENNVSEDSVSKDPNHELSNWGAQYSVRDGATQAEQPVQVMRARQIQKSPRVNEEGHDETDMSNPEEKSEVQIGQEIKTLADKLIQMHQPEEPEQSVQPPQPPVNERESVDDMEGELDEAGGGAVQHSSYRSLGKPDHGNLKQDPKTRWANDLDENKKSSKHTCQAGGAPCKACHDEMDSKKTKQKSSKKK